MKKSNSLRIILLASSLLLQLNILCFHSHGAAGDVDLSFDPGFGVNGPVNAVVVQPDGKMIIGDRYGTTIDCKVSGKDTGGAMCVLEVNNTGWTAPCESRPGRMDLRR